MVPNASNPPPNSRLERIGGDKIGSQVTDSEEHPGWKSRLRADDLQDIGGNFKTSKSYVVAKPTVTSVETDILPYSSQWGRIKTYIGNVWAVSPSAFPFPKAVMSSDSQLDQLGATAIARCKPTNSAANIGVALGELVREGIPKLVTQSWRQRTSDLRGLSDEHLNYQFGLKPLGQEIGTFAYQVTQAEKLLAQYERDAGRVVRRRYTFPPIKTTEYSYAVSSSEPYYGTPPETGFADTTAPLAERQKVDIEKTTEVKRWFSGAFIYYLPRGYDARNEMDRKALLAKEILGLDLDLETIWNLAPWSWAVDWFTNAGDVISNVNSFLEDGLVMPYGYMMEHSIVKAKYTRRVPNLMIDTSVDSHVTLVTETKIRRKANPFGFGTSGLALSPLRASILAALGITRKSR